MSKHHANALLLLGIAACAGFLLSIPAVAGSNQGLQAMESGELFLSPLSRLSTAGNGSEPFGSPAPPETEGTPDLLTAEAGDAPPDLPVDAGTEIPAYPETPEPLNDDTVSGPVTTAPVAGTTSGTAGTDDERLARLINAASISLMRLSMEHAHALYLQDTQAASVAADDLHALSVRLLTEVQPLKVSPEQQPVKDEFIRSLSAYSTASETLLGTTGTGEEAVPVALNDLDTASRGLETVSQQVAYTQPVSTVVPAPETAAVLTAETEEPMVQAAAGPVPVQAPAEILPVGERYTYDDQQGENMISLLAESAKNVTSYETTAVNGSTMKHEADAGHTFLLVVVKATNLGHKGNSDLYTIEAPGRDAFALEHRGTTYTPVEAPAFTSLGESFDRKALERYESLKGYLYFDVPATLNVSEATLRADLGYAGTPAWDLGREFGNADAV